MSDVELREISRWYRWFADNEAEGRSPLYADLARRIADDEQVLSFVVTLPSHKRQPNLLLASYRSLFGLPSAWAEFSNTVLLERERVSDRVRERSTQTNEPARCATILPVLAQLPSPLALIEVGAAAGLCLLLDHYSYAYNTNHLLAGEKAIDGPVFRCRANPATPIPQAMPKIVWRSGLDLNPLDPRDSAQMEWLEALVWPGQDERLSNLRKAVAIARQSPPKVIKGNLTTDLEALCSQVPAGFTAVIFHSAVLNYVESQSERDRFTAAVTELADHWIANESPMVLPQVAARTKSRKPGAFLLSLDGEPVAWTDPHGAYIDWLR